MEIRSNERTFLIPVNTIVCIANDFVTVDREHDKLMQAPVYDQQSITERTLSETYGFFGIPSFWSPDYTSPSYGRYYVV